MTMQPLLRWRKETALRSPNAIEDLDQFDRNMGCVSLKVAVYPSGVTFMHNRYSCHTMGDIASLFDRKPIPAGDITPQQKRRSSDLHRKVSAHGKIKYDPDDLGIVYLWVPFEGYQRWVDLLCANPDMQGMPLFVHKRVLELAKTEADEFCSQEDQAFFRARLFDEIANVSAESTKAQRKLLGRALSHQKTAESLRRYVQVEHENDIVGTNYDDDFQVNLPSSDVDANDNETPCPEEVPTFIDNKLAGTDRNDGDSLIPRPGSKKRERIGTWAESQRAKKRGVAAREKVKGQDSGSASAAKPKRGSGLNLGWGSQVASPILDRESKG
jgi:hypothetical protein